MLLDDTSEKGTRGFKKKKGQLVRDKAVSRYQALWSESNIGYS